MRVRICVPLVTLPSACTLLALIRHSLSENDHVPSPKEPSSEKFQERMVLARGSQPIICVPTTGSAPSKVTVYFRMRKFFLSLHFASVSTRTPGESSVQAP